MKIQLEEYFHQISQSNDFLTQRLTPLLKHIKSNNINSIHQINLDYTSIPTNTSECNRKTLNFEINNVFTSEPYQKDLSFSKTFTLTPNSHNRKSKTAEWKYRQSISMGSKRNQHSNPQEKSPFVSPASKIKKHLIQTINLKTIERELYKKPDRVNLFQHFCQQIQKREAPGARKKTRRQLSDRRAMTTRQVSNEEAQRLYDQHVQQQNKTMEQSFRKSQRKKFWMQQRYNQRKNDLKNRQILSVRGTRHNINIGTN